MRFLVDEDLPRSLTDLFERHGYEAVNVRDTALRGARDERIAAYAKENGLCVITGDLGFADLRNYPPSEYSGIVVLRLPRMATAKHVEKLMESLFEREEITSLLPGKTATSDARLRLRRVLA